MAARRIVIGQRQIEQSVSVEVDDLDAVRGIVLEQNRRQRLGERQLPRRRAIQIEPVAIMRLRREERPEIQVGPAVAVQVADGGRRRMAFEVDAGGARNVNEMPIGLLLVERAGAVVGDDEIEVAVEIEIAETGADAAEISGAAPRRRRRTRRPRRRSGRRRCETARSHRLPDSRRTDRDRHRDRRPTRRRRPSCAGRQCRTPL